jgi:hypothetical protein
MKKTLAALGAVFLLLAFMLFAPIVKVKGATPTNLFSVLITESEIESTTIGATTPSTGVFTSLSSGSGALNGSIGGTTPSSGVFTSISGPFNGTIGAATPNTGVFTSLNSTSGGLNGTIGATTPSTGAFTSMSANSATLSGLTSGNCVQASTGGLLTTSSSPCLTAPPFTGTSGFQVLPSGLMLEWAEVTGVPTGTGQAFNLPMAFPHACFGVNATDNGGSAIGSNPRSIGSGCVGTSQVWLISSGTPSGPTFYMAVGF